METPRKVYRVLVRVPKTNNKTNKWDGPHLLPLSEIDSVWGLQRDTTRRPATGSGHAGLSETMALRCSPPSQPSLRR